jgi:hypothetical protein
MVAAIALARPSIFLLLQGNPIQVVAAVVGAGVALIALAAQAVQAS